MYGKAGGVPRGVNLGCPFESRKFTLPVWEAKALIAILEGVNLRPLSGRLDLHPLSGYVNLSLLLAHGSVCCHSPTIYPHLCWYLGSPPWLVFSQASRSLKGLRFAEDCRGRGRLRFFPVPPSAARQRTQLRAIAIEKPKGGNFL